MKHRLLATILFAFVAAPVGLRADMLYTFDTVGDLNLHFTKAGGNTGNFSELAGQGIGGSQAIAASTSATGTSARIEELSFAGNLSAFTISYFFRYKTPTTTGSSPWLLGFSSFDTHDTFPIATSNNPDDNYVMFGLINTGTLGEFRLRISNMAAGVLSGVSGASAFTMTAGAWYQLAGAVSVDGSNNYDVTLNLYEAGADGTVGALFQSQSRNDMANLTLVSDPAVHAFFASGSSAVQRGADVFDNFLSPVPEPGAGALLLFAIGLLPVLRRRFRVRVG